MSGVELQNVSKRFGAEAAVSAVNLTIGRGEFVSLLGPSGCGKSTTLRMIAGLEKPDEGRVLLNGRDVTALPSRERQVGVVFQSLALFPHMTVSENVAFGLRMRRLPKRDIASRVSAALEMVRLDQMSGKLPAKLSGGQQQRVALARALVIEPSVLLLDEPLSALDRNLREEMQAEIRRITRSIGMTTAFVTHDQHEAYALSDRIAVMNRGRIVQFDSPDALFRNPASTFVANFTGVANVFGARSGADRNAAVLETGLPVRRRDGFPDTPFHVGWRPEDLQISASRKPDAVSIAVKGVVSLGAITEIQVSPVEWPEMILVVRCPSKVWRTTFESRAPDQVLWLTWDDESLLVFTE